MPSVLLPWHGKLRDRSHVPNQGGQKGPAAPPGGCQGPHSNSAVQGPCRKKGQAGRAGGLLKEPVGEAEDIGRVASKGP